jgi:transposase InsO family protein
MQGQGGLTIERMCELGRVSRAGFYRYWQQQEPKEEEMELRARMQQIVLTHRGNYGYRRVSRDLKDQGLVVNHKRVLRLMQQDNLLVVRRRKFVLTTDSRHDLPVYMNLAARMQLSGIDQLWVADITYIRLREVFVYLAVVLDAFSRRVVGWAVDESLHAPLALAALDKAIAQRKPAPGLVHHSDRGVQYASEEYVTRLCDHGIVASMSRLGNPYDNAKCESFMKTLKQEEIYTRRYRDQADLEAHMEQFLEQYYNRQRLHSALGYRSPEAFENLLRTPLLPAARLSFPRHEEIYRSDVGSNSGRTSDLPEPSSSR